MGTCPQRSLFTPQLPSLELDPQRKTYAARLDLRDAHGLPNDILIVLSVIGINNISAIWDTEEWNGHTAIRSWRAPHVEPVKGSDGTQFRPDLKSGDSITVWAPELFRSASMTANSTASLEGVSLLRFGPDPSQGAPNPTYYQTFQGLMNVTGPTAAGEPFRARISR